VVLNSRLLACFRHDCRRLVAATTAACLLQPQTTCASAREGTMLEGCAVNLVAQPVNLVPARGGLRTPPQTDYQMPKVFLDNSHPVDVKFSKWLQDKLLDERAVVTRQLEEQFSLFIDEHHKALVEQVQQLRARAGTDPSVTYGGPQPPDVTMPIQLISTSGSMPPTLLQDPQVFEPSMQKVQIVEPDDGAVIADAAQKEQGQRKSLMAAKGAKLVADAKKTGEADKRTYDNGRIALLSSEPHYSGPKNCVTNIVHSSKFEALSMLLIVINTCQMAAEVEYTGKDTGFAMRYDLFNETASDSWPGADLGFQILSYFFNTAFLIELVMRIVAVMPHRAIRDSWVWLDTVLVALGWFESFDMSVGGLNPSMMRLVRLTRVMRILKVVKSVKMFDSLFLLMKSIQASVDALLWSFIILILVMAATGMLLNQLLFDYMNDPTKDIERRREVFRYYGTFAKSMVTMYEITLGNWVPSCRTLMGNVTDWYGLFYCVYSCTGCFAVVNVIRAVFITETNRVASEDDEVTIMKKKRAGEIYLAKVHDLFMELDNDGDGRVSQQEFMQLGEDKVLRSFLGSLDLDFNELEHLFHLLDDGDGQVELAEFVYGVSMLRGAAKSIDVITMLKVIHRLEVKLDSIAEQAHVTSKVDSISLSQLQSSALAHGIPKKHILSA